MPGWSITCTADEVVEDMGGVGTTFRLTTQDRSRQMEFTRVLLFLLGWAFKKTSCGALQKELVSLKDYCESKPVLGSAALP